MAVLESRQSSVPDRLLIALLHTGAARAALRDEYGVSEETLATLADRPLELLVPEDLHYLRDDGYVYELWKGELIRMSPGKIRHGTDAGQLATELGAYLKAHRVGRLCLADTGFRVGPAGSVIALDLAFIHIDRLKLFPPDEYDPVSPDLAVEVVSPGNTGIEIKDKVASYLAGGARLVWVRPPKRKQIRVHRADGTESLFTVKERLDGEDLLPGFSVPVRELFT